MACYTCSVRMVVRPGWRPVRPRACNLKGKVKVKGGGPSWAHPVVIGGRLYLRDDTNLYCFDVKGFG